MLAWGAKSWTFAGQEKIKNCEGKSVLIKRGGQHFSRKGEGGVLSHLNFEKKKAEGAIIIEEKEPSKKGGGPEVLVRKCGHRLGKAF